MAWFECHSDNRDDPRLNELRRFLKIEKAYALGHVTALRMWAADNPRAYTGDLSAFTPEEIAQAALCPSEPVEFVKALVDAEYISRDPEAPAIALGEVLVGGTRLTGWSDICGEPIRKRMARAQQKAGTVNEDLLEELIGLNSAKDKPDGPLWSLFMVYKYIKKSKDIQAVKEDRRWDELNKQQQLPYLKRILGAYNGDLREASRAVIGIGEHYERLGYLSWDGSTVIKRLTDWDDGRLR